MNCPNVFKHIIKINMTISSQGLLIISQNHKGSPQKQGAKKKKGQGAGSRKVLPQAFKNYNILQLRTASRGLLMGASKALDRQTCWGPSIPTTQWIQFGGAAWELQGPQRLLDARKTTPRTAGGLLVSHEAPKGLWASGKPIIQSPGSCKSPMGPESIPRGSNGDWATWETVFLNGVLI